MNKKLKIIIPCIAVIAVIAIGAFALKPAKPAAGGDTNPTAPSIADKLTEASKTALHLTTAVADSPSVKSVDLMLGVKPGTVADVELGNDFAASTADFSINLFKRSIVSNKSSMVSPYSVMNALAMTANGAAGNTLAQMQSVLGTSDIGKLNSYMRAYNNALSGKKSAKFSCANSIWFKDYDGLSIEQSFLQKNADYYGAAAYKAAFDAQTVNDINSWISKNTNGMIDNMLDDIDFDSMMYLVNATAFEAEWMSPYTSLDVIDGTFTSYSGAKQDAKMLCSNEYSFINYGGATGFIKPYKDNEFAFVALLPNEGTDINDYISTLSGAKFLATVGSAKGSVITQMPKFDAEYSVNLNNALKGMGMTDAFDDADFTRLGTCVDGDLYISDVEHKTFISVTEKGTRAGAATYVEMNAETAMMVENRVILDRPFVYAIIDTETNLPIFIGTVMSLA